MQEVVSIASSVGEPGLIAVLANRALSQPGLIAYECPNCVYVMSELLQPGAQH